MAIALIDADIVNYQSAAAAQRDFGFEVWSDATKALDSALEQIEEQMIGAECDDVILCYSPRNGTNFRKKVMDQYKMNRKAKPKPVCYVPLRDELEKRFTYKSIDWLEADDLMSLMHQKMEQDTVIVSIDKDMGAVPCTWYNPMKMAWAEEISIHKANYNWLYQTLIGDTTDGYKGLMMCGDKKAKILLSEFYECDVDSDGKRVDNFDFEGAWKAIEDAYDAKGQENLLEQARVARILRAGDYDMKNNRIKLYNPNKTEWLDLPNVNPKGAS